MKKLLSCILALMILLSMTACGNTSATPSEENAPVDQQEDTLEGFIKETGEFLYNTVEEAEFGPIGGEWLVMGLARSDMEIPEKYYELYFRNLSAYTSKKNGVLHENKYTEYSRVVLAATAIGKDVTDVGGYDMLKPLADFKCATFQGINSAIYALLALDSGNYEIPENREADIQATRDMYVDYIIGAQTPNGGWTLFGSEPEVDMTAMALQALAKYQHRSDVAEAIEKGLAILSQKQGENGDYNVGSETVSQTIVALSELGISLDDSRFVKNENTLLDALMLYSRENGSFSHLLEDEESDQMATEQAFYAMVAADRFIKGKPPLYTMK